MVPVFEERKTVPERHVFFLEGDLLAVHLRVDPQVIQVTLDKGLPPRAPGGNVIGPALEDGCWVAGGTRGIRFAFRIELLGEIILFLRIQNQMNAMT